MILNIGRRAASWLKADSDQMSDLVVDEEASEEEEAERLESFSRLSFFFFSFISFYSFSFCIFAKILVNKNLDESAQLSKFQLFNIPTYPFFPSFFSS